MKKWIVSIALVLAPVLSFAQVAALDIKPAPPAPAPLPPEEGQPVPPAPGQPERPVPPPVPRDLHYNYNFGSVFVNSRMYADFSLTAGERPVVLDGISIRGMMYDASSNCPKVLPPRGVCWTRVFFWPRMQGGHWGDLMFYLNDRSTIYVHLFGNGI